MGTTTISSVRSRKEMIRYLVDDYFSGSDGYKLLDHSTRGNVFYGLVRHPDGNRFIAVFKLSAPATWERKEGYYGWGYKGMTESMGPYYFDCPERILKESDCCNESSIKWRDDCRRLRREQIARKAWIKSLAHGTVLKVHRGNRLNPETKEFEQIYADVTYHFNISDTYYAGILVGEKEIYRWRWDHVALPDIVTKTVSSVPSELTAANQTLHAEQQSLVL